MGPTQKGSTGIIIIFTHVLVKANTKAPLLIFDVGVAKELIKKQTTLDQN